MPGTKNRPLTGQSTVQVTSLTRHSFQVTPGPAIYHGDNNLLCSIVSLSCEGRGSDGSMSPLLILLTIISSSPLAAGLGVEVEDVTGRQLEAALQTEELVAVMFCKSYYQSCSQLFPVVPRPLGKLSQLAGVFLFQSYLQSSVEFQTQTNHHLPLPSPSPLLPSSQCYSLGRSLLN